VPTYRFHEKQVPIKLFQELNNVGHGAFEKEIKK